MFTFFYLTGVGVWTTVLAAILFRLGQVIVFAYRMGWRKAKSFDAWFWLEMFVNPADAVGGVYFPSSGGRYLRAKYAEEE